MRVPGKLNDYPSVRGRRKVAFLLAPPKAVRKTIVSAEKVSKKHCQPGLGSRLMMAMAMRMMNINTRDLPKNNGARDKWIIGHVYFIIILILTRTRRVLLD